jgi:hypothetical protein
LCCTLPDHAQKLANEKKRDFAHKGIIEANHFSPIASKEKQKQNSN